MRAINIDTVPAF